MPIRPVPGQAPRAPLPEEPASAPGGDRSLIRAAFETENIVGSFLAREEGQLTLDERYRPEPGFNVWERVAGTEWEQHYEDLASTRNTASFEARKSDIERERQNRELLEANGWAGFGASLLAGTVDLPSLIPFGAGFKAAQGASLATRMAAGAASGAVVAPFDAAISEAALHATQNLRTTSESLTAIALSPAFGAGIGAAGAAAGAAWDGVKAFRGRRAGPSVAIRGALGDHADEAMALDDVSAAVDRAVRGDPPARSGKFLREAGSEAADAAKAAMEGAAAVDHAPHRHAGEFDVSMQPQRPDGEISLNAADEPGAEPNSTVGAMQVERDAPVLEDYSIADPAARFIVSRPSMGIPNLRIMKSQSVTARAAGLNLYENFFGVKAAERGDVLPAVETLVKVEVDKSQRAITEALNGQWLEYSKRVGQSRIDRALLRSGDESMSEPAFMEAVGRAMRRGDRAETPEVEKAAQLLRKEVVEPLKKRAIEEGLLPEGVDTETAASYFSRIWDVDRIEANRPDFVDRMTRHFMDGLRFSAQEAVAARARLDDVEQLLQAALRARTEAAEALRQAKAAQVEAQRAAARSEKEIGAERAAAEAAAQGARAGRFTGQPVTEAELDQIVDLWKTARAARETDKPEGLVAFVVRNGGIKGRDSHILAFTGSRKARPGLIKKKGARLDDMGELAHEAGYFEKRPTEAELLDALADDFGGKAVLTAEGRDAVAAREAGEKAEEALSAFGIGPNRFRSEGRLRDFFGYGEAKARREGGSASEAEAAAQAVADAEARLASAKEAVEEQRGARAAADSTLSEKNAGVRMEDMDELELPVYAREAAEAVYDTLTDPTFDMRQTGAVGLKVGVTRGPLIQRTLHVKDLDFEDYLVDDASAVLTRYNRLMSAEVELTRRYGSSDMKETIRSVQEDYKQLMDRAPDDAARNRLAREWKRVVDAISMGRDFLRGDRSHYERFGRHAQRTTRNAREIVRNAMAYNYITSLGDVTASSAPDVFRHWQVHGSRAFFSDVLPAAWSRIRGDRTLRNIAQEDAGIAETILNSRIAAMTDLDDPYAARLGVTPYMENMGVRAGKMSGIVYWNQFNKEIAVHLYISRMRRMFRRGYGKLNKGDRAYLRGLKVSEKAFQEIGAQLERHGRKVGKLYEPNTEQWTNEAARRTFRAAMRADADSVVVTPGLGDKPNVLHNTALKPMSQFKNFWLSAHQRMMLRGLQEDKARFLSGASAMVAMGMLVEYWKRVSSGRDLPDNWGTLVASGVDRAGVLPLYMELNNMQEHVTGFGAYRGLGYLGQLSGGSGGRQRSSRYQDRSVAAAVLGPTAGKVAGLLTIASDVFGQLDPSPDRQGINPNTLAELKKLTPFINQPGIKLLVNRWALPAAQEAVR